MTEEMPYDMQKAMQDSIKKAMRPVVGELFGKFETDAMMALRMRAEKAERHVRWLQRGPKFHHHMIEPDIISEIKSHLASEPPEGWKE